MQWLNKVDDALDWVLGPAQQQQQQASSAEGGGKDNISDENGEAIAAAALAAVTSGAPQQHDEASSANAVGYSVAADNRTNTSNSLVQIPAPSAIHDIDTNKYTDAQPKNETATAIGNASVPKPPPPPPPPAAIRKTETPPPTTVIKRAAAAAPSPVNNNSLPPENTVCPSTPLVAMAGEFLVLDESPYPITAASHNEQSNNANNVNENKGEEGENCEDRSNCQPPESIFAESITETSIREEAASAVANASIDTQLQIPLTPSSRQYSDIEDIAKASPAPTRVMMIDRVDHRNVVEKPEPSSWSAMKLNNGNIKIQQTSDDKEGQKLAAREAAAIPPPPPRQIHQPSLNERQQSTISEVSQSPKQNHMVKVPPSPSTFIIHLPQNNQEEAEGQPSPMKMPQMAPMSIPSLPMGQPPPPPPPYSHNSWNTTASRMGERGSTTPNPNTRPQPHSANYTAQSAARTAPTIRRMTPARPTPGVIRRRLREPSLSPPESPREESNATSTTESSSAQVSSMAAAVVPPPPPFIPADASMDESDRVSEIRDELTHIARPPALPPPHIHDENNTRIQEQSKSQSTSATATPNDDWEVNISKDNRSSPIKNVPPPPFHDQITPIVQNRKVSSRSLDKLQKVAEKTSGKMLVEEASGKELTPEVVADDLDDAKAVNASVPEDVAADGDRNEVVQGSDEAKAPAIAQATSKDVVTDAITGWFHRMGSTGGAAAKQDTKKEQDEFSDEDSFHSHVSNDSELTESNDADDFAIPSPTFEEIQADEDDMQALWDPSLNRYGFFHVRLLRAQRLPCASGSSINATLSLQPWEGRIRIPTHTTVEGPEGAGVCLRWDKPSTDKRKGGSKGGKDGGSKDGESPIIDHSMVHAYNNEDTPVPTISLELSVSSLGVFDRFLCSVSIPCHELLRDPRNWKHKWHTTNLTQAGDKTTGEDGEDAARAPLMLLETCFEPKVTRATVSTLSDSLMQDQEMEADDDLANISGDSDTLGSIPQIIRQGGGLLDDDSISKSSTLTPALVPRKATVTKAHLLRVRAFWTPTWCAVCSKSIITGWMQGKNFECEACHIFCCRDCQLQVDARIPCGSELAKIAVKKAEQYQIPSFSQVMTTLAPQLDVSGAAGKAAPGGVVSEVDGSTLQKQSTSLLQSEHGAIEGIGVMNIRVLRACIFEKTFPSEAEPEEVFKSDYDLRNGDHYVRVSWLGSKESKRTKSVLQTSKPVFDSEEMIFDVSHYGMEYKLEVVDANTDKPIGSCLLSAQGLLQWQRDDMLAKKDRLLLSFLHLRRYSDPRRMKIELRTGVKDGFGLNFFNSSKTAGSGKEREQSPGEISGWLEVDVHLEEDRQLFYSANPRRCPSRAEEEFDIALIQLHIARISAIIESIQKLVSNYIYAVSWDNEKLTGASMAIFVVLTLRFNLEYLGSLPIGCLVLYMLYLLYRRVNGHFKDRWTLQEKEALIKSETKIEKNQSIFRPLGLLQVGDLQGKNLKSKELGLPGNFYASIMYDPLRYADEKMKASLIKVDSSSGCTHEVGATVSPGITSNPNWTHVQESPQLMRLKHLLPDDRIWHQENEMEASLSYPILQPITDGSFMEHSDDDDAQHAAVSLMPWEQSCGAVVIQVRFSDVLGTFQMFDNVLGEVVIPLSKLAGSGRAVEGWFRLLEVGTKDTIPGEAPDETPAKEEIEASSEESNSEDEEIETIPVAAFPELYVKIKFSSNALTGNTSLSDEMESFKVICEEMSRTASIAAQENSIGVIGSSLNTINTVRTLGGKLQNQIALVVDMLERIRNAFNFSNPRITVFILLCLSILWIVLALIPTRVVVLVGGLAQFGATAYIKFCAPPPKKKSKHQEKTKEGSDSPSRGNPIENLFLSIPTDEDLRRTYFWEARRLGEKEREKFAVAKRQNRLEKLWKAKWHGPLELKETKGEQPSSPTSRRNWSWEPAFGLIEGHRFIWWRSEKHFDTGEAPLGRIFFAGHSGLAGLSPLDLRELSKEEIPFVVSIFGRGTQGQQKITLLATDSEGKASLENAVLEASTDAKAD